MNRKKMNDWWNRRPHPKNNGYPTIRVTDHPVYGNATIMAHVAIVEADIGRYLQPGEVVHHKDGTRDNNHPSNLCVMTKSDHRVLHSALGDVGIRLITDGHLDMVLRYVDDLLVRFMIRRIYTATTIVIG
jgi:hypothetical protein